MYHRPCGRLVVCVVVTVVVSLGDEGKHRQRMEGLVYGLTKVPSVGNLAIYQKPLFWGGHRRRNFLFFFFLSSH